MNVARHCQCIEVRRRMAHISHHFIADFLDSADLRGKLTSRALTPIKVNCKSMQFLKWSWTLMERIYDLFDSSLICFILEILNSKESFHPQTSTPNKLVKESFSRILLLIKITQFQEQISCALED